VSHITVRLKPDTTTDADLKVGTTDAKSAADIPLMRSAGLAAFAEAIGGS
jgi:hypothetical protein